MALCNQLLQRMDVLFPNPGWAEIFEGTLIEYDSVQKMILDHDYEGAQLWNIFFARIYLKRGASWLSAVEPLVSQMVQAYEIEYPAIFQSRFTELEITQAELDDEAAALQDLRRRLEDQEAEARQKMMTCPLTGLHNERFFRFFVSEEFSPLREGVPGSAFIFITLDRLAQINLELGDEEGDRMLVSLAYLLENHLEREQKTGANQLFKLNGPRFLYYLGEAGSARRIAESLRRAVVESDLFLKPVTISQGLVEGSRVFNPESGASAMMDQLLLIGEACLREAQKRGMNTICDSLSLEPGREKGGSRVLIVDPDEYYTSLLARELEARGCRITAYSQGEAGLTAIQENPPDLIISELSVPMLSGLELRSRLIGDPRLKGIPFILVSHRRDDDLIRQAHRLRIEHFLSKPVSLVELLGLVEILLEV